MATANWLIEMLETPAEPHTTATQTVEQECLLLIAEAYTLSLNPRAEGYLHHAYAVAIGVMA